MVTRPQTVGYALWDSPAGLVAWMYDKFSQRTYTGGEPERSLTKDEMLDDITLYWLTNSAISSARYPRSLRITASTTVVPRRRWLRPEGSRHR